MPATRQPKPIATPSATPLMNFQFMASDIRVRVRRQRSTAATDEVAHHRRALAVMQGADLFLQLAVVAGDAFVLPQMLQP